MMSVVLLNAVMQTVIILSVVMLSVAEPLTGYNLNKFIGLDLMCSSFNDTKGLSTDFKNSIVS